MSTSAFLLGMFVTWAAIGVVSAIVMGRRGYAPFSWLILGTVFGPLVVPLAISRHRQAGELAPSGTVGTWEGPVDVLVGIDGSAESIAAAEVVSNLLGGRIGRLTLATVIDYDTALGGEAGLAHREALADLDRALVTVRDASQRQPETVVLTGKPADALVKQASDGQFDVLAVGSRGRGASRLLAGSVATRLARGALTPVLIVGAPAGAASSTV